MISRGVSVWAGAVCLVLGFGSFGWGQSASQTAAGTPPLQQNDVIPAPAGIPLQDSGDPARAGSPLQQGVVPRLIKFTGRIQNLAGKPIAGPVDVTFSLYAGEAGGSALWFETQTVQADSLGNYTVLLGAMTPAGVPMELFTEGEARWLGVQVTNLPEQPRVLLVSVPYAMKAGDAETLGGKPASAFVLASQAATETAAAANAASVSGMVQARALTTGSPTPKAITITTNYLPMFADSTGTLTNSILTQSGASIGINTPTPSFGLDANTNIFAIGPKAALPGGGGTMRFRDDTGTVRWLFGIPGTAGSQDFFVYNYSNGHAPLYIENGAPSYSFYFSSSGNVGIGTKTPAQKLDVAGNVNVSGSASLKAATFAGNLKITGTGNALIFPDGTVMTSAGAGTSGGTITGVAPGLGLAGGGTAGNVSLAVDTSLVPTFATASNVFSGSITASAFSGDGTNLTNVNAAKLGGLLPSAFQPAGTYASLGANTFTATQIVGSGDLSLGAGNINLPATNSTGTAGVLMVGGLPYLHFYRTDDVFLGKNAGNFSMTGGSNTGIGSGALGLLTTGGVNTAVGDWALHANTTGGVNTAIGSAALESNTTGNDNTAIGMCSLCSNTTGQSNTATGELALGNNTTASGNTAVGRQALSADCSYVPGACSANYNTAVGYQAGTTNTFGNANVIGSYNTFLGADSGPASSTQLINATAIGANAVVGESNALVLGSIDGINGALANVNVGIGTASPAYPLDVVGDVRASGTFRGNGSGLTNVGGSTTVITGLTATLAGDLALPATNSAGTAGVITLGGVRFAHSFGSNNTFLGQNTGNFSTTGSLNTAMGTDALASLTTGPANTAIGVRALHSTTTGSGNAAMGDDALKLNSSGALNTAVGHAALYWNTTGNQNTALGDDTLYYRTMGGLDTAIGSGALYSDTDATGNTAVGASALLGNCDGVSSGCTASYNTALGFQAGTTTVYANENKTGAYNTFLGAYSGLASTNQVNNATAIGANAVVGADNSLVLGSINGVNGATASVNVGIGTATPTTTLQVAGGDVSTTAAGSGVIVKSPSGTKCARIGIDDNGALLITSVTCP